MIDEALHIDDENLLNVNQLSVNLQPNRPEAFSADEAGRQPALRSESTAWEQGQRAIFQDGIAEARGQLATGVGNSRY